MSASNVGQRHAGRALEAPLTWMSWRHTAAWVHVHDEQSWLLCSTSKDVVFHKGLGEGGLCIFADANWPLALGTSMPATDDAAAATVPAPGGVC